MNTKVSRTVVTFSPLLPTFVTLPSLAFDSELLFDLTVPLCSIKSEKKK
jgi:hypothetical protein